MIAIDIPGHGPLALTHLILDLNGTIATDGALIDGVRDRVLRLGERLEVHLVTADTYGVAAEIAPSIGATLSTVRSGHETEDKAEIVERFGAAHVAAIGNGANDARMLELAALGIAVMGQEGIAREAFVSADVIVPGINEALDLLLMPQRLRATLRH